MGDALRGFWNIDVEQEPDTQVAEAAEFLYKRDWGGGTAGLLEYGDGDVFPPELQGLAWDAICILHDLDTAIRTWAADRGVLG